MKLKKSTFVIGAVILVVALITGCGLFSSRGPYWSCERGFHGKGFSTFILKRIDKKVEKLNLTETQQQRYADIRERLEADFKKMSEGRKALFKDIQGEINKENPDVKRIAGLLKERLKEMPAHMERHLDYFLEFYGILSEGQKALLLERVRDRIGKCES